MEISVLIIGLLSLLDGYYNKPINVYGVKDKDEIELPTGMRSFTFAFTVRKSKGMRPRFNSVGSGRIECVRPVFENPYGDFKNIQFGTVYLCKIHFETAGDEDIAITLESKSQIKSFTFKVRCR